MTAAATPLNWQRLALLSHRFADNCAALATRDPALAAALRAHAPAGDYAIAEDDDQLRIGLLRGDGGGAIDPLIYRITPAGSRQICDKLFPAGACTDAALIAGLDQGWLWKLAYNLPCRVATRPGYRPPLYFLARRMEQLWIACHLHDWRDLLADPRAFIFVGDEAAARLQATLSASATLAGPKISVTLDPGVWPAGVTLDTLTAAVNDRLHERLDAALAQYPHLYGPGGARTVTHALPDPIRAKLAAGVKLRVLGITSRFTTFLQHSMRDWLAAFDADGHTTHLVIEAAAHEQCNNLVLAEAAVAFRPDLVVMIDHHRGSLGGLPPQVPCVMWIQDHLPHLFRPDAGRSQGPLDFVIGFGRAECTRQHHYPPERFMAAIIPVNDARFAPPDLAPADISRFACDASFVSHASRPPESFIAEQVALHASAKPLLTDAFDRLKSIYDDGLCISHPLHVRAVVQEAMVATRSSLDADSLARFTDFFTHQVNNAFLRHQMLEWTADLGVDLRLYGNGWDKHPRLAKFARGPADNQTDLRKIYRATRVNLQATPHGAVHQRTLEGLCAGGFFLLRYVPGDRVGEIYRPLWAWCQREGIESDDQLLQHATPDVLRILGQFQRTVGCDPFKLGVSLIDDMRMFADLNFQQSAAVLWPDDYERVAFDSRAALHQRLTHFLSDAADRDRTAARMRAAAVDFATYRAITRRTLAFVAGGLGATSVGAIAA